MSQTISVGNTKRAFWTVAMFYMLVAFEFFYMASPFALYFYSVYRPGLGFISTSPALSWLSLFFLPHIVVETSSVLVNLHNAIGAGLFLVGFVTFCLGAGQVYYYKLTRKGAVTGGVYNFIRHPQYLSLAVSSLGLMLLWPRYLALLLFVGVVFGYYFLALAEEDECERKFGPAYIEYKKRTHMFLPFKMSLLDSLPGSGLKRYVALLTVFVLSVALSLIVSSAIRGWAVDSLFTFYSPDAAYISLGEIDGARFREIVETVQKDEAVQSRLANAGGTESPKFINYVLPAGWFVSEIPMNPVKGAGGHHSPAPSDENHYKIVFTLATLRTGSDVNGRDLILNAVTRAPVMEVWIDLAGEKLRIEEPPDTGRYEGIPVPIF